jgi:hypothetical protein
MLKGKIQHSNSPEEILHQQQSEDLPFLWFEISKVTMEELHCYLARNLG